MICAVIVSFNSDKVFRCYESVKNQADLIVIIDNATTDKNIVEKLSMFPAKNPNCKIILNDENLGIASALNQAAYYAKNKNASWLLTLDDDSELLEDSVPKMMDDYERLPSETKNKTALMALRYVERNTAIHPLYQNVLKQKTEKYPFVPVKYALTSGNFIKMSIFEECGFFNEDLFIDQVDNDFDFRVRKKGFIVLQSQNNCIIHEIGYSQKRLCFTIRNYSPIRRYYLSRNCVYIFKRYFFFDCFGVLRIFAGAIFGGFFKIVFFEEDKLKKCRFVAKGLLDGIFNNLGCKYKP
jgi:rhamnosyltransferase